MKKVDKINPILDVKNKTYVIVWNNIIHILKHITMENPNGRPRPISRWRWVSMDGREEWFIHLVHLHLDDMQLHRTPEHAITHLYNFGSCDVYEFDCMSDLLKNWDHNVKID